jgi:hypothetical protein
MRSTTRRQGRTRMRHVYRVVPSRLSLSLMLRQRFPTRRRSTVNSERWLPLFHGAPESASLLEHEAVEQRVEADEAGVRSFAA